MMTGQQFYDLANKPCACHSGLRFLEAAARPKGGLENVTAVYLFDKMLSHYKRTRDTNAFSGAGYLRWTFFNLLSWPRKYGEYTKESRDIMDLIFEEAGCRHGAEGRYGYPHAPALPSDISNHLLHCSHCGSVKTAVETLHRALVRAFS